MHDTKRRKNTSTMKSDCLYKVVLKKCSNQPGQESEVIENNHNHGGVLALSALPRHCISAMTEDEKAKVRQMNIENYTLTEILISLCCANPDSMLIACDIYNLLAGLRAEGLAGKTLIEWLLEVYLQMHFSLIY